MILHINDWFASLRGTFDLMADNNLKEKMSRSVALQNLYRGVHYWKVNYIASIRLCNDGWLFYVLCFLEFFFLPVPCLFIHLYLFCRFMLSFFFNYVFGFALTRIFKLLGRYQMLTAGQFMTARRYIVCFFMFFR